jgi:hypothetical protein
MDSFRSESGLLYLTFAAGGLLGNSFFQTPSLSLHGGLVIVGFGLVFKASLVLPLTPSQP